MARFNRELIIEIGPFSEWEEKKDSQVGIRIVSNGNLNTLKASITCQKNILAIPNNAIIRIWNLKKETRQRFKKTGLYIKVFAGYENGSHELLFSGSLEGTITKRSGADIITTLNCMTGESNLVRSTFSKTYEQGVPVSQIVTEMAGTIPGIVVDPTKINVSGTIGTGGFSYMGSTKFGLQKLADQFGFSWNINNGTFVAIDDMKSRQTRILLNVNSGLKEVSPRMFGINQIQEGVDISSIYVQGVDAGQLIRVESEISPEQNGDYACHTIEYDLCPKTNQWDMTINSFKELGNDGQ